MSELFLSPFPNQVDSKGKAKMKCLMKKKKKKKNITKTNLFKYTENFTTKKRKFSEKNSDIFHISAQNVDCGYTLELPW